MKKLIERLEEGRDEVRLAIVEFEARKLVKKLGPLTTEGGEMYYKYDAPLKVKDPLFFEGTNVQLDVGAGGRFVLVGERAEVDRLLSKIR